jgi:predicted permease
LFVTPNYFGTLRTALVAGRGFDQSRFDQITPPELTAVISHTFAQELDGGDPLSVVGRSVKVNGTPLTIIGVTAPRFNGPIQSGEARTIWLPLSTWETLTGDRRIFNNPDVAMFEALARLQPGVSVGDAVPAVRLVASRASVDAATPQMPGDATVQGLSATAEGNRRLSADVVRLRGRMQRAGPYQNELHEGIPIFSTIALLILLVCTTTVNSLLVGAGVTRRYEIGVRLALGASRWRVVRQLLTEIGILALAAGLLGMYAFGALAQLAEVAQDGYNVTPDGTTTAFTVLYALLTATLCGLSPALHVTRTALAEVLKESAVTTTSRSRLQRSFVVAQIAIAMPLLVSLGAALAFLTQGLRQSPHAALRERLIVLNIDTQSGSNAARPDPVPRVMERISALGGIEAVLPRGTGRILDVSPVGSGAADSLPQTEIEVWYIAPDFFKAVEAPVILGRDFVVTDSALEVPPLILSDSLAQLLFPSGAIGQRLRTVIWPDERPVEMEVIGVARAGYGAGFLTFPSDAPLAFAPLRRGREGAVLIRTAGPAESLLSQVREVALLEAPGFPISRLTTMSRLDFDRREELKKLGGAGLGSGAIALLMAAIGLYAMLNVAVGQRRREIGVRLAIGARRNQVVGLFFRSGLRTALLGVLLGLPFSIIALRWINAELLMPTLYVAGIAVGIMSALVLVAAFASWLPARRAAMVDPSLVLRSD